jgi:hypothetical protein
LGSGQENFGFRLIGHDKVEDFVTADEEALDPWLNHLEKLALLTEVEEDFHFVRQIGDGSFASVHLAVDYSDSSKRAIKSINKSNM